MALSRVPYYHIAFAAWRKLFIGLFFVVLSAPVLILCYYSEQGGPQAAAIIAFIGEWFLCYMFVNAAWFVCLGYYMSKRLPCPLCGKRGASITQAFKRDSGHMLVSCSCCRRKAVTDILYYTNPASTKCRYILDTQFKERH